MTHRNCIRVCPSDILNADHLQQARWSHHWSSLDRHLPPSPWHPGCHLQVVPTPIYGSQISMTKIYVMTLENKNPNNMSVCYQGPRWEGNSNSQPHCHQNPGQGNLCSHCHDHDCDDDHCMHYPHHQVAGGIHFRDIGASYTPYKVASIHSKA